MEPKTSNLSLVIDGDPYKFIYHTYPNPIGILEELTDSVRPPRNYIWQYGSWHIKQSNMGKINIPSIGQMQMIMDYFLSRHIQGTTFPIEFKFYNYNDFLIDLTIQPLKEGSIVLDFQLSSMPDPIPLKNLSLDNIIENKWENLRDLFSPVGNLQLKGNYCQIKRTNDGIVYIRGHIDIGVLKHHEKAIIGPLPPKYRPSKKVCFPNDCKINTDGMIYLRGNIITFDKWLYFID